MSIAFFPSLPGQFWPVTREGPIFDTVVQESVSGKQTAYPKRLTPKWRWTLDFEFLRSASAYLELQTLAGFHASVLGRCYPFAYTDAVDNAVTAQLFGTGDGDDLAFQLLRAFGGFIEPVYVPTGTPQIYVNGTLKTAGTDYVLSAAGLVTFASAPAASAALTWTGSFAWLCRFDDDKIDFSNFMVNLWEAKKISFTSVLP